MDWVELLDLELNIEWNIKYFSNNEAGLSYSQKFDYINCLEFFYSFSRFNLTKI